MNKAGRAKLEKLRADFAATTGEPFENFFCPILFRDERVELCRAHIINQAFRGSDPTWTIQRKDVDGFYGSLFEADFSVLQHRGKYDHPIDVLTDPKLSR